MTSIESSVLLTSLIRGMRPLLMEWLLDPRLCFFVLDIRCVITGYTPRGRVRGGIT